MVKGTGLWWFNDGKAWCATVNKVSLVLGLALPNGGPSHRTMEMVMIRRLENGQCRQWHRMIRFIKEMICNGQ